MISQNDAEVKSHVELPPLRRVPYRSNQAKRADVLRVLADPRCIGLSLRQIAALAGTSHMTVARVLREKGGAR